MATWDAPIDSQTDPDAPLTSNLGKRWDNNVIATAEGASGAPRVSPAAWGHTVFSGESATGTLTLSDVSAYGGANVKMTFINSAAGAGNFFISLSSDGTTFSTPVQVGSYLGNGIGVIESFINFSDGAIVSLVTRGDLFTGSSPVVSGDVSHIRFTIDGTGTITMAAMAFVNAGVVA